MTAKTRREFLKTAAAASGVVMFTPDRIWAQVASGADTSGAIVPETTVSAKPAQLSIARWQSNTPGDVQTVATSLTEQAIAALGGMGRFVSRGDVVWLKPNIGWNAAPELAANTNPDVVTTLARLCFEAGAKQVKVGDNPCNNPRQTYQRSGIAEAVAAVGADVITLDPRRFKDVALGGQRLSSWPLYPEVLEADLVINIPIVKHHSLCRVSLGMKNYMGIIGGDRSRWHQALSECLCDITDFMKPRLTVLDAVRILTAHGPRGGNPSDVRREDVVAAGTDIVALDAFGAELLGHDPSEIVTVKAGYAAGLGQLDYRSLTPIEVAVS